MHQSTLPVGIDYRYRVGIAGLVVVLIEDKIKENMAKYKVGGAIGLSAGSRS